MKLNELLDVKYENFLAMQSNPSIKSWQQVANEKGLTLKEFVYMNRIYITYEDFSKLGDDEWIKMKTLTKCIKQKYGMDRYYLTKKGLKELL